MAEQSKVKYAEINTEEDTLLANAVEATYTAVLDSDTETNGITPDAEEDAAWLKQQRLTHQSLHWLQRPSIVMIGICVFLFSFGMGVAESSRQFITYKLACNAVAAQAGKETCDPVQAQVLMLSIQQAYIIVIGIATILSVGKLGPLSDQYGRRLFIGLLILVQIMGKTLKVGVMQSSDQLHFKRMVLAEFFTNVCGGIMTLIMLSNCYVSDIAAEHQRTFYLGVIMALFYLGLSLGPTAGTFLASWRASAPATDSIISLREYLPLKMEIVINVVVLLFVVFVLPESRTEGARRMSRSLSHSLLRAQLAAPPSSRFSWSSINFLRPLRILTYPDDVVPTLRHASIRTVRRAVIALVACDCFLISFIVAFGEVTVMYSIYRFSWNAKSVGVLLTVIFSLRAVTLLVISPLLTHKVFMGYFGLHANKRRFAHLDWAMLMTGYTVEVVGMLAIGMSQSPALFLWVMGLTSLGALATPAMSSGLVKFFPELRLGEVFGALTMVKNSLQIVVPYLLLNAYKKLVVLGYPHFLFYFAAFVYALCILIVSWVVLTLDKEDSRLETETEAGL